MAKKTIINKDLPEVLFNKIIEVNLGCNYHNHFDLYITELGEKECTMEVEIQCFHINPRDIAHGAVSYALLDSAMGMAMRTINRNVVTLQSSINYTATGHVGDLFIGKARIVEYGKKIIIAEGKAYNQEGTLIAVSTGTFYDKGIFCEGI